MKDMYWENEAQSCNSEFFIIQIVVNLEQTKEILFEKERISYVDNTLGGPQASCFAPF